MIGVKMEEPQSRTIRLGERWLHYDLRQLLISAYGKVINHGPWKRAYICSIMSIHPIGIPELIYRIEKLLLGAIEIVGVPCVHRKILQLPCLVFLGSRDRLSCER